MAHRHRPVLKLNEVRGWTRCVTPDLCARNPQRARAHGGLIYLDTCRCGAKRETEGSTGWYNYGPWQEPEVTA